MIRNKNADIIRAIKKSGCTCKDVTLESLEVTENDTYTAEEGKAWDEVTVNVESGGGAVSLPDAIVTVLQLEDKIYGIPDLVILTAEGEGIVDGSGIHREDISPSITIGTATFTRAYVIEDESRFVAFSDLTFEAMAERTTAFLLYKIETVQNATPADQYPEGSFVTQYNFPNEDNGPWCFAQDDDIWLYKYNNEYYVTWLALG